MPLSTLILLIIIGLIAGLVGGGLGIGGGVIILPALIFVLGYSQHQAQGTTLAIMVPPITIVAAYNYYKHGNVNITAAIIIMIAFVIGSYFGSAISIHLPAKLLKKIFALLMFIIAVKMFFDK